MVVFPNAKINIGLHVVSKRTDGYHNLETVLYPVPLTDALEMAESDRTAISFSGLAVDGPPENNLVLKAYYLLKSDFDLPPVRFHLHKVIPSEAGLGGGSSDAAFTLKMLNDFFQLGINGKQLKSYAAKLGSDCPFFIDNKPVLATGTGVEFSSLRIDISDYKIVVVKSKVSVSTVLAYKNVIPSKPAFNLDEISELKVSDWRNRVVNDFEKYVFTEFPEIENLKSKLYENGAVYASMTGSGSAVYGLFSRLPVKIQNKIPESLLFVL